MSVSISIGRMNLLLLTSLYVSGILCGHSSLLVDVDAGRCCLHDEVQEATLIVRIEVTMRVHSRSLFNCCMTEADV